MKETIKCNWTNANKVLKGTGVWSFATEATITKIIESNPGITPLVIEKLLNEYTVEIHLEDEHITGFMFI
jgi:hypothetical protein